MRNNSAQRDEQNYNIFSAELFESDRQLKVGPSRGRSEEAFTCAYISGPSSVQSCVDFFGADKKFTSRYFPADRLLAGGFYR
jgi:hypothetical protein